MKSRDIFDPEIIDVARGGEADCRSKGAEPDCKIEIAVEQAVDQPANERVAGADAVDNFDHVTRGVTEFTAGEEHGAGLGVGGPRQGDERHAVARRDRCGEALTGFGETEHVLRVALGQDQELQMRRCHLEHSAGFGRGCQRRAIVQII